MLHVIFGASQVVLKNLPVNAGDRRNPGSVPGSGLCPGVENRNSLQCSCLENPMDRGAWAIVHGVAKRWTRLKWLSTHACMSTESMIPSNHLILCCYLLLLPSIFSSIRVFSNELALCIKLSEYWSFSFNISPSNEYLGLISFRIDWFDFLAAQGTLKRLLQHHSSKASILHRSAFFMPQLSHAYMAAGKTIALIDLCR